MEFIFECPKVKDLDNAAEKILIELNDHRIVALYGQMGSGKTTLVKSLCKKLNSADVVTSPTFTIMNEYKTPDTTIFHFDFYRIKSIEEVYDLGYEDFFYSGNYCFIEWPEKIKSLLPADHARIYISEINNARHIKLIV